ncbi:MAG: hypothetical protein CVT90_02325 [Candidatus Altiarchaeales archaeon HGW-Altiarchaeales-3]|nr:MAG: hypothetical protein CVT90_02325 [Candidatus Altiarchaeales archaeon HGW-Altiarchaeales-3]
MKLLISPKDEIEALEAILGGADIIDVKNPAEGSLGANFPWVIRSIRDIVSVTKQEVSATIGDFINLPGTASLAALGAACCEINYIKVGLKVSSEKNAGEIANAVVRAVKEYDPKINVVICGYADAKENNLMDCMKIPKIASESGADIAMLDTLTKNKNKNLFDHLAIEGIEKFTRDAHDLGLKVALGGSLKKEHIVPLYNAGVDIIGIRGAACELNDRTNAIKKERVKELKDMINKQI